MELRYKRCSACGIVKPSSQFYKKETSKDGLRGKCKECWAKQTREYRQHNKDSVRQWASYKHRKISPEYIRQYYSKQREKILEYKRRYRQRHSEKMRKRDARYREEHPMVRKAQYSRRRAQERDAKGEFSFGQWKAIKRFYSPDGKCLCCGEARRLQVDHVVPLSKGGTNWPGNLQPLCKGCNLRKHTDDTDYRFDNGEYARSLNSQ